jgi:putative transposase
MARAWRIEFEGASYHVLSRGNEQRSIFLDNKDRAVFLDVVGQASERFEVEIFAFVLMTNHYHLLMRTNRANLSKTMQWIGVTYTRQFNNRHLRSGHLFQGRFKSILVENDAYVVELSCYLHRNPLRAGLVKRLIDFKWSSYPVCGYGRKGPEWLKTDLILSYFSGVESHKAYRQKVQHYANEEGRLWEDFRNGLILGTQSFVESIRSTYLSEKVYKEIPQRRRVVRSIDKGTLLEQGAKLLACDVEKLKNVQRLYGKDKENRDLLVYLLWERGVNTNEEIGSLFGITYSSVSHIVNDLKSQIGGSKELKEKYKILNSQYKM